jgi:hypothetical protein
MDAIFSILLAGFAGAWVACVVMIIYYINKKDDIDRSKRNGSGNEKAD